MLRQIFHINNPIIVMLDMFLTILNEQSVYAEFVTFKAVPILRETRPTDILLCPVMEQKTPHCTGVFPGHG